MQLKFISLILSIVVGLTSAQSQPQYQSRQEDREARILRSELEDKELQFGKYKYSFDTSNGLQVSQSGYIKNPEADPDDQILSITGFYTYIDANNNPVRVEYTADENGFRPREYFGGKNAQPQPQPQPRPVSDPVPVPVQPAVVIPRVVSPKFGSRLQAIQPLIQASAPSFGFSPQSRPIIVPQNQFGNPGNNYVVYNPNNGRVPINIPSHGQYHVETQFV